MKRVESSDQSAAAASKPAGPRRRTREERSAETRSKLLNGTYRLLLRVGHAGLRSANISSESGVSRGGLLHHFPSKESVIAAVYEWKVQEIEDASWPRIEASASIDSVEGLVDAIIADARARFFGESFKVILDILVASAEEEELAEILKALAEAERAPAREGWADRLVAAGVERKTADKLVSFLWNAVKGLAIRGLVNDDSQHTERVIALARKLAVRRCEAVAA